jgi:CheY-like chemotaxis protein
MRVMIAGADLSTLSSLRYHLSSLGHKTEIARNGWECLEGLHGFVPDLLVMELDIYWSGSDGVISTLIDDPRLNGIPVVFFTEINKQLPLEEYPRIIAQLKQPFQVHDLSQLRELLDSMELTRSANPHLLKQSSPATANCDGSRLYQIDSSKIRHISFEAPSMFPGRY